MLKSTEKRHAVKDSAAASRGGIKHPVIIAGIGVGSGGTKSFKQLLGKMPSGLGIAYVLVLHPGPSKKILPIRQLSGLTALEVVEATEGMQVLADRIHVMPSDTFLNITGGRLTLHKPVQCDGMWMPIDHFLCTLAHDFRQRSCGIVLSGSGSDGTLGLSEIKAAGGRTFVLDPAGAKPLGMLQSAIDAGVADAVLAVGAIAEAIAGMAKRQSEEDNRSLVASPEESGELKAILDILRSKVGYDFSGYKPNTLVRRIRRRMTLGKIESYADFAGHLREHPEEVGLLQKDLLIGVTEFFRQPQAWEILEEKIVAALVENVQPGSEIRVWVPGCSTGQEAYSQAMVLTEQVESSGKKLNFQVFATDADLTALAAARSGSYTKEEIGEAVSAKRLKRFFSQKDGRFQILKQLREKIVFAPQNLTADPPFSRLDLISCRNLLMYLEQPVQQKIIVLFHFALRSGGFLFLGTAETTGDREDLFEPVSKKWRIYRRIGIGRPAGIEIPVHTTGQVQPLTRAIPVAASTPRLTLASAAQQMLLDRFAPACVMIDRKLQVLYLHGKVEDYLTFPTGEPTNRIVDMAREGLRARLRGVIGKCIEMKRPVSVIARVRRGEKSVPVKATVSPLRHPRETEGLLLVTFEDHRLSAAKSGGKAARTSDIQQMADELKVTREELQSTIDQLESSNDQLKASHEEVTASNEELQSGNEELETSKEELQSLNEELNTINARLQEKVGELENTNNDVLNLLSSTAIATVFLDKELRVKRYTPASTRLMSLIPSDLGRPVADVLRRFADETLLNDARLVLTELTSISKEIQAEDGRWYFRRITPYRTQDDRIEGVVLTFVDVSDIKQAEEALRLAHARMEWLSRFPEENPSPVLRVSAEGEALYSNPAAMEFGGWKCEIGRPMPEVLLPLVKQAMAEGREVMQDVVLSGRVYSVTTAPFPGEGYANVYGRDITERKLAEAALSESEERVRRKLDSVLLPEGHIGHLELSDIIDVPSIQSLMDDFFKLARIPMSIIDLKGNVLVGVGWQEICKKFHRAHPDTCRHCVESDTLLSADIPPGQSRLYKCKNHMWDIAAPIMVGGQHVGHVFSGQFFFEDEPLDYELFRSQARQYGFDEKEYIAALDKVPRLSREAVDTGMAFLLKLADMLSKLSYSNLKLARSLTERDTLTESLRESREQNEFLAGLIRDSSQPLGVGLPDGRLGLVNRAFEELTGYSAEELQSIDWATALTPPEWREMEQNKLAELHRTGLPVRYEKEYIRKDGTRVPIELLVHLRNDSEGKPQYYYSFLTDITERKRAEENLQTTVKRFYNVLSSMYGAVLLVMDDGRVEFANQAFCEIFGLAESPESLNGLESEELTEKIKNAFLQPDEAVARIQEIVRIGQPVKGEEVAMSGDRTCLRDFIPIVVNGIPYGRLWHHLDITERQQAAEELRQSEERYRTLFNTMIEGFCIIEVIFDSDSRPIDYRFLEMNPAFKDQTGLQNAQGRLMRELAPDHEAHWFEIYGKVVLTGKPARFVNEAKALGRWYDVSAYRIGGPESPKVAILFNDITERMRAEEALRKAKDNLEERVKERTYELYTESLYARSLIEASLDPLVTISVDGKITDVNHASEEVTGVLREQLIGSDFSDYFTEPEKARVGYEEVFRQGFVRDYPLELKHRDGHVTPVLYNASVYRDETGRIMGVFAAARDITERRRAEETVKAERQRLYDVLETLPVYAILLTPDYHVSFANRFFRERFGEDHGRRCYEYLFNRTEPCEICETYTVQKTGKPHHWEWLGPDRKNYDIFDFPFTDSDGSPLIMEVGIDITERKQAEAALRRLASELAMAEERERKRIAGVLHDDIAQTLATVRMRLDLLQGITSDRSDQQTLKEAKALLVQSLQETRALMNDLGNPVLFDVGLKAACEALANQMMGRHPVRISCDIRDTFKDLNPDVKTILYQAVKELLNNVAKHSRAHNAQVMIDMQNEHLRVKVTDDGVGFDPRMLGAPTTESGFGLYNIRERLIAIGGSLGIESISGTGTVVTAILPTELD